jgi:hypothetical protein
MSIPTNQASLSAADAPLSFALLATYHKEGPRSSYEKGSYGARGRHGSGRPFHTQQQSGL